MPPPPSETSDVAAADAPVPIAPKPRADTDIRTGKSRIVDVTETGIPAAPPRATTDVEDAFGVREQTAQTLMAPEPPPPRDPEDLLKTFEQNPKTFDPKPKPVEPSATVESAPSQNPKTPIPTMDRLAALEMPERAPQVPISTAPSTLPPPRQVDAVPSGPTPACPQCEAPMAWVDEHLRFYCKQCRMYF